MVPEIRRAGLLGFSCFAALAAYTALIGGLDLPSAYAVADWMAPVTRLMKHLAPSVSDVETDLRAQGSPTRAVIIAHAFAVQWLLAYACVLLPLPSLWRGRGYLKAAAARARLVPNVRRRSWLGKWSGTALALAYFVFLPFFGSSSADGRSGFDLALSNSHLFGRLLFLGVWIVIGIVAAIAFMRMFAGPGGQPRPESPAP
jgi:hypothetical protein